MKDLSEKSLARELIKAAVMRKIFCPACGKVMDMRRAVLIETAAGKMAVSCTPCFEKTPLDLRMAFESTEGNSVYRY